jgi:hypothetical protein
LVELPTEFETARVTVKPGAVFDLWYTYVGFRSDEVPAPLPLPFPSPKFQDHTVPQLPTGMFVDESVNVKTVVPLKPLVGFTVKLATGRKHGTGVGDAVGPGVGVAVGPAVGAGVGVGLGVGEGDGVGVGVAVGSAAVVGGSVMICADAVDVRVTLLPPKNGAMIGVSKEKCPSTVTVTVFPMPVAQDGEQASWTSAFWTTTNEPLASLRTRHMTRLSAALQLALGMNDVGLYAASYAPSRAALLMVICE